MQAFACSDSYVKLIKLDDSGRVRELLFVMLFVILLEETVQIRRTDVNNT